VLASADFYASKLNLRNMWVTGVDVQGKNCTAKLISCRLHHCCREGVLVQSGGGSQLERTSIESSAHGLRVTGANSTATAIMCKFSCNRVGARATFGGQYAATSCKSSENAKVGYLAQHACSSVRLIGCESLETTKDVRLPVMQH
jgi:hypothetical protein